MKRRAACRVRPFSSCLGVAALAGIVFSLSPTTATAKEAVTEATLVAGFGRAKAVNDYNPSPNFGPKTADDHKEYKSNSSMGAVELAWGKRLGNSWLVSGAVRVGGLRAPDTFSGEMKTKTLVLLGPKVIYNFGERRRGLFVGASGGVALDGWNAAIRGGYDRPLNQKWGYGLGLEASFAKTDDGEVGDQGSYDNTTQAYHLSLLFTLHNK